MASRGQKKECSTKFANREIVFALVEPKSDTGFMDEPRALAKDLDRVRQETLRGVVQTEIVLNEGDGESAPLAG